MTHKGGQISGLYPIAGLPLTIPAFDTSADAALLLVARLKEQGLPFYMHQCTGGGWVASFIRPNSEASFDGRAETLPLAICRAFIKATQGETKL